MIRFCFFIHKVIFKFPKTQQTCRYDFFCPSLVRGGVSPAPSPQDGLHVLDSLRQRQAKGLREQEAEEAGGGHQASH